MFSLLKSITTVDLTRKECEPHLTGCWRHTVQPYNHEAVGLVRPVSLMHRRPMQTYFLHQLLTKSRGVVDELCKHFPANVRHLIVVIPVGVIIVVKIYNSLLERDAWDSKPSFDFQCAVGWGWLSSPGLCFGGKGDSYISSNNLDKNMQIWREICRCSSFHAWRPLALAVSVSRRSLGGVSCCCCCFVFTDGDNKSSDILYMCGLWDSVAVATHMAFHIAHILIRSLV